MFSSYPFFVLNGRNQNYLHWPSLFDYYVEGLTGERTNSLGEGSLNICYPVQG